MLARFNDAIKTEKPTHTIVFGGTNDLWFGLNNELIISNIYAVCKQAIYNNVIPVVGVLTPSFNLTEINFLDENYFERLLGFRSALIDFCYQKGLQHIDFGMNMNKTHFMEDGVHPNAKGQQVITNTVKQFL